MMKFSEKIDQKILQDNEPLSHTLTTLVSQQTFTEEIEPKDSFIDFQHSKNHNGEQK